MTELIRRLKDALEALGAPKVIACSGGLDSLLLSVFCYRHFPQETLVVHAQSPAVPKEALLRFREYAQREKWECDIIETGELSDEKYHKNPLDRCYVCKSHLYAFLTRYRYDGETRTFYRAAQEEADLQNRCLVLSGANRDDLSEYRPGLEAAARFGVRHPFVEAGLNKADIRTICRHLGLEFAEIAPSPCLSSRVYTGTPITEEKLFLIDDLERALRDLLGIGVLRCRLNGGKITVEVPVTDRSKVTADILERLKTLCPNRLERIESITVDPKPYRPGRAFVRDER